ncbi:MAG: response regulator [Sulfuritalea sp.]|nr:response regulator [Sulfuritalea sp.]
MKRILVVDDEPAITRLTKLNLESTGDYEVFTETRGSHAVEAARACRPDLILLDIMMPDMLGSDVAEALHADPALRHIKVVFLTVMLKKRKENNHQDIGGQHFIAKPCSTAELISTIEEVLGEPDKT